MSRTIPTPEATSNTGYAAEAATALSTTYTVLTLDSATEAKGIGVPDRCTLSWLQGEIDTIASSAGSITWYLALDSGGDVPITDEVTETIVTGKTTATDGGVATRLDMPYALSASGTQGKLYVVAKTDVGTCNLLARIYWSQ